MVDSHAQLINGLSREFTNVYSDVQNRQSSSLLSAVMGRTPVDNRYQDFGYREAAPHVERWIRGNDMPLEGMGSKSHRLIVHNWAKGCEWHQDDREDDQTGSLMNDVRGIARSVDLADERAFFDMLLGQTNFLPVTQNAPDGLPVFSSSDRFETSGGNIISGWTGNSSQDAIDGYYDARTRLLSFKDGKGQPLWAPETVDSAGVIIVCSTADQKIWDQGLKQTMQVVTVNAAGAENPGASGVAAGSASNLLLEANKGATLWPSSRVSSGEAYVIMRGTPVPAFFCGDRRAPREVSSLAGTTLAGDRTKRAGMEWIGWEFRRGYKSNLPYGCIKLA
jgi:hypothetical protein